MKKHLSICIVALFAALSAQAQPNWLKTQDREQNYPSSTFFYGFVTGTVRSGETETTAAARLLKDAQAELTEKILVLVRSTQILRTERTTQGANATNEQINSTLTSDISTSTSLELTNLKTGTYSENGLLYAFAYVNKYELIGYYSASLTMNLQQLESILSTAQQLEQSGEKSKARAQYESAASLLAKIEVAQNVLVALDANAATQREKTVVHRNTIVQALARLSQGVYVFIESSEDMFGKKTTLITDEVKSVLIKHGCAFTTDASQADFILKLNASARKHPSGNVFTYADVKIEIIKVQSGKTVFTFSQEELNSQDHKGSGSTFEEAARMSFKQVSKKVAANLAEKLSGL